MSSASLNSNDTILFVKQMPQHKLFIYSFISERNIYLFELFISSVIFSLSFVKYFSICENSFGVIKLFEWIFFSSKVFLSLYLKDLSIEIVKWSLFKRIPVFGSKI